MDTNNLSDLIDRIGNSLEMSNLRTLNEEILNMRLRDEAHKNEIKFYKNIAFLSSKIIEEIKEIDDLLLKIYFIKRYVFNLREIYTDSLNKLEEINDKDFCFLNLNKCNELLKIYQENMNIYNSSDLFELDELLRSFDSYTYPKIEKIVNPVFDSDGYILIHSRMSKEEKIISSVVFIIILLFSSFAMSSFLGIIWEVCFVYQVVTFSIVFMIVFSVSKRESKEIEIYNSKLRTYKNDTSIYRSKIIEKFNTISNTYPEINIIALKLLDLEKGFKLHLN